MNWTLVDIAAAILLGLLLLGLYVYFSRARPGVKPPPPPADDWGAAEPLVPAPIRPLLRPMIEELAGTWEVQAELETDAEPGRRETLRECADTLRMLLQVSDGGDEEGERRG